MAQEIVRSGRAEEKLRQIIASQGGNPKILPRDIEIGEQTVRLKAKSDGKLLWINNSSIVEIARMAGAPKDKGAGILFNKKIGDNVSRDDVIFTVYAEKSRKLSRATELIEETNPVGVGKRSDMIIHMVREIPELKGSFVLER